MKRILILWKNISWQTAHSLWSVVMVVLVSLSFTHRGQAQNCGLTENLLIDFNSIQTYPLEITDVFNDDLSAPDQGLCGVEIRFIHSFVENLELWLESPAGQQIQLIGPNTDDQVSTTFFALWDIAFVPCLETAEPDLGYEAVWNNDQANNFVNGGQYNGSYYPALGCLEDFNMGPCNGTWSINIANNPSAYQGAILDFRLIFCDNRGMECCFADAGALPDTLNVLTCVGDSSLIFDVAPEYANLQDSPDTIDYGYTYAIAQDSILIAFDSTLDLTGYAVGNYQICGISYKREELDSFPTLDGVMNIDSLRNNLTGFEPFFCGRITDSCFIVEILPVPDPTFLIDTICQGDSYLLGDSTFTATGNYAVTLASFADCDSIVNLDLTVLDIPVTNRTETICEGDTAWIGPYFYTATGMYADTLNNFFGCDSIVNLNLTVLRPINVTLNETICQGDDFIVGDSLFFESGTYQVDLLSAQNCDSIVTLNLTVLDLQALITGPDTVDCYNPDILLDGSTSSPSGALEYAWTNLVGTDFGADPTLAVNSADTYILRVSQTDNGTTCTASDTLVVAEDLLAPQADAGADATLTCTIDQLTLGGPGTTQNENVIYLWETNTGNFIGSNAIPDPDIDTPGDYTFTVTDTTNGCSTIDVVTISIDTIAPTADPGPDRQLDCNNPSIVLDASNSSTGIEFEYEWESLSGIIPDGATTTAPTIAIPDTYQLIVNNSVNGCADTALVEVVIDTLPPTVFLAEPDTLNCEVTEISLNATGSDSGFGFDFYWNIYEGGDIVSGADSFEPRVNATGRYEIVILNLENGCRDSLSVSVTDTINTLVADPGTAGILDCEITQINLDASASSGSNDMIYCWSTSDGHIVGDSNIVAIVVDEPGNYTLTVKDTVTMCRAINTIMVEQNTNFPEAEAGTSLTLNCRDTVHILEGSALNGGNNPGFSWTGPCIDSGADSPNPVVGCPGWYYLTVTNPDNNCEVTDSVEIFLNETTPVAHAGLPDTLTCTDSLLVLDAGLSEGDDLVFEWTGPGIVSGANSPNPEINIPGTYKVVVRNTQSFCQDSATVEIAIDTLPPQIDLVETDSVTCLESIITLGGTNTSIGPDFEYSWITNEGHIVGPADESTIEVDSAGVYGFFVTNIRNGCTSAEFAVVLADTLPPFANAGPDRELTCGSDSVLLNGTASASGDFITYEWSGDCIETSPFADSVWVGCTGIYTLTVNNTQNGCSASNEAEVSLNEQAPLAVLPDTAFISCETGNTQLDATGSVNGNLSWQFEGMPINLTGLMPTITETGTYSLIVNNPGLGCSDTASVLVLLDCQPIINIAIPDTLTCTVNTVMLDAGNSSSGAQYEYAWTAEDQSCIVNGADTPAPLVRCAGEYTLILTNVAVGLSDTMTVSVIATDETPNAEAGLPDTLNCIQLTTLLDGSASAADNPLNYLWTNLNGDTIAMTVMAEVSEPDVYLLEVTDQLTGCSDVDAVIISGNTAVPNISFSNNIVPCEADTIDIQAFVNPPGNYSYTWTGAGIISNPNNLNIQVDSANWFYLTVLNNANGCETQDSIQIRRQSCGPCVQIAIPDSITCNVQTVTLEGIICETCIGCDILWTTDDGTIDSQDGLIAVVSASGTYILTVTDPEGFSTEIEVEVTENREVPVADAGLDQNLNCRDSVLTLEGVLTSTGEHYRYLWSSSSGNILSSDDSLAVEVDAEGLYYFEVRNTETGCEALDSVLVGRDTVQPIANAGTDRELTCEVSLVTLNGSGSSFGSNISYQWTTADPDCLEAGANSLNPFVSCAGTYLLTVTNVVNGCFDTASVQVTLEDDLPFIPPIADTLLTCRDTLITLEAAIVDTSGYSLRWCRLDDNNDPILPCLEDSLRINVEEPGRYLFELVDNNTGCSSSEIVNVDQNIEVPTAEAGATDFFNCSEDSLQLNGNAGPDLDILTIQWFSENGSPVSNDHTLTPFIYQPDTYTLVVTNNLNQCASSDEVVILQDVNTPEVEAGEADLLTCEVDRVMLNGSGNTTSGEIVYNWTTNDGNIVHNAGSPSPTVDEPGMYYLTVLDPVSNCSNVDSVLVEGNFDAPEINVLNQGNLSLNCQQNVVVLDASASVSLTGGGLDFSWTVNPVGHISGGDPNSPVIEVDEIGVYQLLLTDLFNGCTSTRQVTVNGAFDEPEVLITTPHDLSCARAEVGLNASNSSSGENFVNEWIAPDGTILPDTSLSPTVSIPGYYYLTITDLENGCSQTDSVELGVDFNYPVANIETPDELDCTITSVVLDGSNSTSGQFISYNWVADPGQIISGQGTRKATTDTAGVYSLIVTNTRNGCANTTTVEVIENGNRIEGAILSANSPSCLDDIDGSVMVESVSGGTEPYLYSLNSDFFSSNASFSSLPAGEYILRIQDSNGCEYETAVVVPQAEEITVDLGVDVNIRLGDSILLQALVNIPDYAYLQWSPAEAFACPECPEQVVKPLETSTYSVEVRDSNGCKAVDYITVSIAKPRSVYVPNTFSPNGDGLNDLFMIYAGENVKEVKSFKIFDRWGNLVHGKEAFQPNDPNYGWDGYFEGKPMNPAVFVYIAEIEFIDGWVEMIAGDLTLMR